MVLSKLLEKVTVRKLFQTLYGRMVVTHDVEVSAIAYDSRRVRQGDMFVAVRGTGSDGHKFAHDAITKGAKVVVLEDDAAVEDSFCMHTGAVKVVVPDTRRALAAISAAYYGYPGDRMTLVGVTGTNGKTTTTSLVHGMLSRRADAAGNTGQPGRPGRPGLIGTIEYKIGDRAFPATHTTPGPVELNGLLAQMLAAGCGSAVMEVSSHALDQRRVDGLRFNVAVFTNLTRDHLDYHATMEAYFDAKASLFTGLGADAAAVINTGDEWGRRLAGISAGRVLTYGFDAAAGLRATNVALSTAGTRFTLRCGADSAEVATPLVGKFNVENILAAAGAGLALGIPFDAVAADIAAFRPVRGRFEPIPAPAGWTVIVDYAHTPDALEKTLTAIREAFPEGARNRIITVFGCGGNRDRKKRPAMGRIAASLGDVTIVTSDNPRDEKPEEIIDEIVAGIEQGRAYSREADRAAAIRMAVAMAKKGDIVLIAGKGHEEYQVIGKEKIPFSDREVAEAAIGATK
jgi:UDP-N-acetylmuramoyl-L-alanyl-D-glutamate--2,6-diaminopimelate ligase